MSQPIGENFLGQFALSIEKRNVGIARITIPYPQTPKNHKSEQVLKSPISLPLRGLKTRARSPKWVVWIYYQTSLSPSLKMQAKSLFDKNFLWQ